MFVFNLIIMNLNLKSKLFFPNLRLILTLFAFLVLSVELVGQSITITGPATVCPNNVHPNPNVPTGQNYSAEAYLGGIRASCAEWRWDVIKDGLKIAEGSGKTFNYNFNQVGQYTLRVFARNCIIPFWNIFGARTDFIVTSRVRQPNPITATPAGIVCNTGSELTFTTDPGLGLDDQTCYYHYEYEWKAPAGWSINGGTNELFRHTNAPKIKIPVNTPPGSYTISVQATIPSGLPVPNNRFRSLPTNHVVQVGAVNSSQINVSGTSGVCNGNAYTYTANVPGGHQTVYSYNWTFPSGWSIQSASANTITLYVPTYTNSYGPVLVAVNTGCGPVTSTTGLTTFPGMNCGGYMTAQDFKVFPNPSEGELNVELQVENEFKTITDLVTKSGDQLNKSDAFKFEAHLYDTDQCVVKSGHSELGKIKLYTHGLQPGTYFLHIHFGKDVFVRQIIVK